MRSGRGAGSTSFLFVFGGLLGLLVGLGQSLSILLILVDSPVKNVVVLEVLANKKISEDLAKIAVIWLVIEAKGASVVEVDGKLIREATAEDFGRCSHLLLHNSVVLLFLCSSFESLPWERAAAEIEHDVAQRFHVITARLLNTKMSVD